MLSSGSFFLTGKNAVSFIFPTMKWQLIINKPLPHIRKFFFFKTYYLLILFFNIINSNTVSINTSWRTSYIHCCCCCLTSSAEKFIILVAVVQLIKLESFHSSKPPFTKGGRLPIIWSRKGGVGLKGGLFRKGGILPFNMKFL